MKPKTHAVQMTLSRNAAAVAAAAAFSIGCPALAQSTQSNEPAASNQHTSTTPAAQASDRQSTHASSAGAGTASARTSNHEQMSHGDRVEKRIAELRSKLQIRPEQEAQWN